MGQSVGVEWWPVDKITGYNGGSLLSIYNGNCNLGSSNYINLLVPKALTSFGHLSLVCCFQRLESITTMSKT